MAKASKRKKGMSLTQKLIIFIIIFSSVLILFFTAFSFVHTTENLVKSKLTHLASDYYENYFYANIAKSNDSNSISNVLQEYETVGLSVVHLRQLLLYSDQIDSGTIKFLTEHCDENKTVIKYYPEPPFTKTSYRIDYTYSCDF